MKKTKKDFKTKYKLINRLSLPIIQQMRDKYEEWYLFGDIEGMCNKFGLREDYVRELLYSNRKRKENVLKFDTLIRLSHMFEIPLEDLITYNAYVDYYRESGNEGEDVEMLKQYQLGKSWEEEVMEYYSKRNYFVYKIPTMNSGTVFDIIVVKNGAAIMIECKHIQSDKLYYEGSGLLKKTDEIEHFINTTGNNVYIYVKSDKTGTFWTTWQRSNNILKERGYITKEDCFPCNMTPEERVEDNE